MSEFESKQAKVVEISEKPQYIYKLEQEIQTLIPDEVIKFAAFIAILKNERVHTL